MAHTVWVRSLGIFEVRAGMLGKDEPLGKNQGKWLERSVILANSLNSRERSPVSKICLWKIEKIYS